MLAIGGAAVIAAALIAASLAGGQKAARSDEAPFAPVRREALFRGIPQDGISLGRPDAPVTLVEYADLQCPYCAEWAREALPTIVEEYVRTGRVRLLFRGLAFIGPDSDKALRAALAAGERNRLWDAVHALYVRQGAENDGWVTDELLRSLAPAGVSLDRMRSPWVERELAAAASDAQAVGVPGTPFFRAARSGGTFKTLEVRSLDAATFTAELDRLLAA